MKTEDKEVIENFMYRFIEEAVLGNVPCSEAGEHVLARVCNYSDAAYNAQPKELLAIARKLDVMRDEKPTLNSLIALLKEGYTLSTI